MTTMTTCSPAALAAEATLIVSGDDDLLSLGSFGSIRMVAAREALDLIASRPRGQ
jgi:predicted nucleic acid-binding protein